MCGIAGSVSLNNRPLPAEEIGRVQRMTAALTTRGPDARGQVNWATGSFGHQRLAIIDPVGSAQPMTSGENCPILTYNGELYNFRQLREELRQRGQVFTTSGDTEVILRAYETWGTTCVEHFRGMFAFAIFDRRERRLFLARDHFGIKPLSWGIDQGCLRFASESGPLLAELEAPRLNHAAIDSYLTLGYIPSPLSACSELHRLAPGHRLVIDTATDSEPTPERYWRLPLPAPRMRSEPELREEFASVIHDSVKAHIVADVPFGSFLSGGLDSLLVTSTMRDLLGPEIRTFTIGFDDPDLDERPQALASSQSIETRHFDREAHVDALELLDGFIGKLGEPLGDSSLIPTWHVSRLAREQVPMVLSGDGGDELFAGYAAHAAWWNWLEMPPMRSAVRAGLSVFCPNRYPPKHRLLANWMRLIAVVSASDRRALWRPEVHTAAATEGNSTAYWPGVTAKDTWRFPAVVDAQRYLPDDILSKVDAASMAHSLEVRTPLVDVEVARFAASLPESALRRRGPLGAWQGKALMREVLSQRFPEAVNRPKRGFAVPLNRWISSPQRSLMYARLNEPHSPLHRLFRPDRLAALIQRRLPSDLWPLIALDAWLRGAGKRCR